MPSGPEFIIIFVILLLMAVPALIVIAIVRSKPQSAPSAAVPAWYADPTNRHELRWFDGTAWTAFVCDRGITAVDPLA